MTIAIIMGVVAFVVVLVVITRSQSRVRKDAKADLEREMEALQTPDILELVQQEADDTGVRQVPGSDGIDTTVLLQVWHRDGAVRDSCVDGLRFESADGIAPDAVGVDDLRLVCDGEVRPMTEAAGEEAEPALHEEVAAEQADESADEPE